MDRGLLDELLGKPGDHHGARRVLRVEPGETATVALEAWDGQHWRVHALTTEHDAIRSWLDTATAPNLESPWMPGTGRRRRPRRGNTAVDTANP